MVKKQHNPKTLLNIKGTEIQLTSLNKILWEEPNITKSDYLSYLTLIAPYQLPFLFNRPLTMIRFPHGVDKEHFYQKNCPDYSPNFIQTYRVDSIDYILCNDLSTLMWLGNQICIEFHIPFLTKGSSFPSEIVMDLDPPSRNQFQLAVKAALLIKEVCDSLSLTTYVKTSGNKGMQVYLPLPEQTYTFEETRMFTSFLAQYLVQKHPDDFTIERLKKNRGQRCYIDYIQHAEGKTIIAPYSPRGNKEALVAAPLWWEEVHHELRPEEFTILRLENRLAQKGDPFKEYFQTKSIQPFQPVLDWLKKQPR